MAAHEKSARARKAATPITEKDLEQAFTNAPKDTVMAKLRELSMIFAALEKT